MANKRLGAFAAAALIALFSYSPASAAPLSMAGQSWSIYTGAGSLSNTVESDPLIGQNVSVLNLNTAQGVNFGAQQRGVPPLSVSGGRFVRVVARSNEPFMAYFLVRATNSEQHYVQYYSGSSFKAYQSAYPYVMAPHPKFGGTSGQWAEIWLDLQSDLNIMRPEITISQLEWVAVRGNLSIASIDVYSSADLPLVLSADSDGDGLTNQQEIAGASANLFRADSDGDQAGDRLEIEADAACGADPHNPQLPAKSDPDQNGVTNFDATLLLSECQAPVIPQLRPQGWRVYTGPAGSTVSVDPLGMIATMSHSSVDPLAMGIYNSSLAEPYPSPRIERDQLDIRVTPTTVGEDFYLFVLVQGNDGKLYYLGFPRTGSQRVVSDAGWAIYLITPLETFYGYDFSSAAPAGGFPIYLDLTAALQAFYPALHVKSILWTAVRGRLSLYHVSYPPEVRLPATEVSSGAPFMVDAHDPALSIAQNNGTLCRQGVNSCTQYAWTEVTPGGPGLGFTSVTTASQASLIAPTVFSATEYTLRLRVRQTTARRPAGIWTEGTMQVKVRRAPSIVSIVPATATGGDQVTISGVDFLGNGTVTIDGLTASVLSWSDTSIVAVVPENASPGTVDVIVSAGGDPSPPVPLEITPNLMGISASSAVSDATLTLTGTNFGSFWGMVEYAPGYPLWIEEWTNTSITVRVQPTDEPGLYGVRVWQNGLYSQPIDLTISPSVFRLQTPEMWGGAWRLLGGNFGQTDGMVTVDGVQAYPSMWSPMAVEFYPPPPFEVPGGVLPVVLTTADGQATPPQMMAIEPEVWGANPATVIAGDTLTIDGGYLEAAPGSVAVGTAGASIIDWTPTQIHATVPATAGPGAREVLVTTVSALMSSMPPPLVTVRPSLDWPMLPEDMQRGRVGQSITFTGANFGDAQGVGDTIIVDGFIEVTPTAWSMNSVSFVVPAELGFGGGHDVKVLAGGQESAPVPFSVTPGITSVAPSTAGWDDVITVTGTSFQEPYNSNYMSLWIGGYPVTPIAWSNDTITATVPFGVLVGAQPVEVSVYGEVSNAYEITVRPTIQEVLPALVETGGEIRVRGTAFGWEPGTLTIGGELAMISGWSDYEIIAFVPESLPIGSAPIYVTVNGVASNTTQVEIIPKLPVIYAVDAPMAGPGSDLVIYGMNFGATQGAGRVVVGGVVATVAGWTDTQIFATVPAGVPGGWVPVSVIVSGPADYVVPAYTPISIYPGSNPSPQIMVNGDAGNLTDVHLSLQLADWGTNQWTMGLEAPDMTGALILVNGTWLGSSSTFDSPTQSENDFDVFNGKPANGNWTLSITDQRYYSDPAMNISGLYLRFAAATAGLQSVPGMVQLAPVISSLAPATGVPGNVVTIQGSGFGPYPPTTGGVLVDGVFVPTTSWSETSIQFLVPAGLPVGSVDVQVQVDVWVSNTVPFAVTGTLFISNVTPASGSAGDLLTITGGGFGATQGTTLLTVSGYPMPVVSWSDTAISATLPDSVTGGTRDVRVAVLTAGGGGGGGGSTQTYSSTNVPLPITDFNTTFSTLTVSGNGGTLVEVNVTVGLTHTYYGDLVITLRHPDGTAVILQQNNGQNPNTTYDTLTVPLQALSAFDGKPADGTWTLEVYDCCGADTGSITNWSLELTTSGGSGGGSNTYTATDIPVTAVDNGSASSYLTVPDIGTIADVNVSVDVSHDGGYIGDLHVQLHHPDGTIVRLQNATGSAGASLVTTFDTLTVPFESLALLNDKSATGTWSLEIIDTYPGWGTGTLNGWSLEFTVLASGTNTYSATDVPVSAVDGGAVSSYVSVANSGTISDVNVSVDIGQNGNYIGDLHIQLHHPDGTIVRLQNATGSESGSSRVTTYDTLTVPYESLAILNGKSAAGTWSLEIIDTYTCCGVGTINGWSLELTTGGGGGGGGSTTVYSNLYPITVVPSIGSLWPAPGDIGQYVTLYGANLGATFGAGTVSVGGQAASSFLDWTSTTITFQVPTSVAPGTHNVVVTTDGVASNTVAYTVRPDVTSVSPTATAGGANVTVSGNGFGASQGASTITLGGLSVPVLSWSNTSILVHVPTDHPPGSRSFVVTVNGVASVGYSMTVRPAITALNPTSGTGGNEIEILGTNFLATQGTSTVQFQLVDATVTSWSNTRITALIPNTTQAGTARSVVVRVNSTNSLAVNMTVLPNITVVAPASGVVGTSVTLTGTNFGSTKGMSTLTIGGIAAATSTWTSTQIGATVPAGVAAGSQPIVVNVGGATDSDAISIAPALVAVSPPNGPAGATITLTGTSFGATQGTNEVRINGAAATVNAWSNTSITAVVPAGLAFGDYPVVVRVGGADSNTMTYSVTPFIASLDRTFGTGGDAVTISGTGFGDVQGVSTVAFGGVAATVVSWSNTSVVAEVPAGVAAGSAPVVVDVGAAASNAAPFMVQPKLTSLGSSSAAGGDNVTLTGTNFGAAQGSVTFGNVAGAIVSWSPTSVVATVPDAVTAGVRAVRLVAASQPSNTLPITIGVTLTSVTPSTAGAGATLTLTGRNFGPSQGPAGGSVLMDGTPLTVLSWTATSITARLPGAVAVGSVSLSVVAGGQTSGPVPLTVRPNISLVTPGAAKTGEPILINGSSFGAAQGVSTVSVDGVVALIIGWADTQIIARVPVGLAPGNRPVAVTVAGINSNAYSIQVTDVIRPSITGLSPASGPAGTTIFLVGSNFGATQGASRLQIGGVTAAIVSWTDTQIAATMPGAAMPGNQPVVVTVGGAASNTMVFTHVRPWIDQVYMRFAKADAPVNLVGRYFGTTPGSVSIGGLPAIVDGWTDTSIQIHFDASFALSGAQNVVVTHASLGDSNPLPLRIRKPNSWMPVGPLPEPKAVLEGVWTGAELLAWGGMNEIDAGTATQTGWRYNPATDSWAPMSTIGAPTARYSHTAVWTGKQMIVWGGTCVSACQTGGRYDPATDTWSSTTLTGAPTARGGHAAFWTGDRMIVWGGFQDTTGGIYDPVADTWQAMSTTGAPTARAGFSAAWSGSQLLVWGGNDNPGCTFSCVVGNGARYDLAANTWSPITATNAPAARKYAATTWTGTRMLVWSGNDGSTLRTDGAQYDPAGDAWYPITNTGAPLGRESATAVWSGTEMLVWGGYRAGGTNTGGRYNPYTNAWASMSTLGAPESRHSGVVVLAGPELIVWGGRYGGSGAFNTGGRYRLDTDTWTPTATSQPLEGRTLHGAVWTGSQLVIWGGSNASASEPNTGTRYNPVNDTWLPMSVIGAPIGRMGLTLVWTGTQAIAWSGYNGYVFTKSGGKYDPSTDSWTATDEIGSPEGRWDHRAVWTGDRMIVWGGRSSTFLNTGGLYDPVTNLWQATPLAGALSPRVGHGAVWAGDRMVVWGGLNNATNYEATGAYLIPGAPSWTAMSSTGAPTARSGHVALWTGTQMIVWGGSAFGTLTNGARYNPVGDTWSTMASTAASIDTPKGVWTGSQMIVWQVGRYDPAGDSWSAISTLDQPTNPASSSTATWIGTELMVWGGKLNDTYYNTGGRYLP